MKNKNSDNSDELRDDLSPTEQAQLDFVERYGVFDKDHERQLMEAEQEAQKKEEKEKIQYHIQAEVDWEIDLHGFSVEEAIGEIEIALELMEKSRLRFLRIIHGGGRPGYGPVKKAVDRTLRSKWKHKVVRIKLELPNSGSTLLELKRM